ncbi:hypothetical protein A1O3_05136 [Capronia epimyces CBS 606.96]|uniref:Iron-sulfur cluster assembly factor IBA57 homolog, mitochondrial n=1 Tax=Capronia epimyces CBS 606.96 TaxID=1182542 RepID=W9XW74_9EURO|nr:uncharacterized protein A1O3_05136 [Capronia epimyces CBS 606.96]EXJ84468.1 hypothetical protein A1O3_05136 [Capronia epimyces CBS 606.96]
MVGVAGKSKGCNTCRKRKVHCDGEKPSCARCQKGNRVCGGYQRERHFKNLSALDRDALLTRTQPLASLTDLRTITTGSAYDITPCRTPETDDSVTSKSQKLQCTRRALSLSELFDNFLDNYIPTEAELQNGHKVQVSWLQAIDPSQVPLNDASLDLAILALSLVCLGRKYGDERLRYEGTANYGRVLHRLQDILSHHSLLLEEQTLASCMVLSTFEASTPQSTNKTNTGGWASHVEGVARLIQFRGPDLHVAGLSHRLFLDFRSTGITHALATRKSTYLAQQDWLTVPWKIQPKSDLDQLLDIMAQIATLIEKAARLTTAFDDLHAQRIALVQQGWEFHSQLKNWYQGFLQKQAGPLYYERPSSSRFLSQPASVFPKSLHFQNFKIARLHLSYWTVLLLLYSSILAIPFSSLSDVNPTSNLITSVENEFTHRQALELARMIAQSMEYLLSEDMHILGPQKVFFALRAAMHVFASTEAEDGQEMDWCKEIFEELDRRGYPFGKILSSAVGYAAAASPSSPRKYVQLTNRTLIRLAGPDAGVFLFNLVPAKILDTGSTKPIYTAFLSSNGRILNDVFIYPPSEGNGEEWFIEADSQSAGDLLKHLRKHKLRSKFQLEKVDPEKVGIYYTWPDEGDLVGYSGTKRRTGGQDPRPGMGSRWLDETGSKVELLQHLEERGVQQATLQDYTVHRMLNGLAEGQTELLAGSSLPQESNIDFFGGIDFFKGCYVGQELTIRTHHTGVVRKRILPCQLYDPADNPPPDAQFLPKYKPDAVLPLPPPQSNISKAHARGRGRSSGKWLSGVGNIGLAICRLEMMTDIQLTADRTNYDPTEQYKVQWEIEGQDGQRAVMLKPFVPTWLREGVEQSLHRKEKRPKPRQDDDEYDEVD